MFEKIRVRPAAYLEDLSGVKFVIEIIRGEKQTYAIIVPPEYELEGEADESLLKSAVANHHFVPYDEDADVTKEFLALQKNIHPDWQIS